MDKDSKFNPYLIGPKPIFSIFQWSYVGYHGPCLVIYENGLVIRAINENPEDILSSTEINSTIISAEELCLLKSEISKQIDEIITTQKTEYDINYTIITDMPCIDIMCNISSEKHIRIKYCSMKNDKISYLFRDKKTVLASNLENLSWNLKYLLKGPKFWFFEPDEIPITMKDCLKFLCEYQFSDLKDYVPFYIDFKLVSTNKGGETVEWPEDLPKLDTLHVDEYSGNVTFYMDGKYYKRILEFCEKNRHKNIKFRDAEKELYYNPRLIFPHEYLFSYNQRMNRKQC